MRMHSPEPIPSTSPSPWVGCTLSLLSDLPQIRERVTIDGYTEVLDEEASPAARANTAPTGTNAVLTIVLDETNSGLANGLALSGPAASSSEIRGW